MAKVVNTATNLGGLATFIIGGHVWWTLGIALAIANIAGAQLGARTVLGGGTKLVLRASLWSSDVRESAWQQWFRDYVRFLVRAVARAVHGSLATGAGVRPRISARTPA